MMIEETNYFENKELALDDLNQYTKEFVPELNHKQINISFIYVEDDEILGRIVGFIHWDYLQIELFFVSKNAQGKGVGTKLLDHIEKIAKKNNVVYILLETMSFNAPKFYEKNGFNILTKIVDSPLKDENRYFYIKYV